MDGAGLCGGAVPDQPRCLMPVHRRHFNWSTIESCVEGEEGAEDISFGPSRPAYTQSGGYSLRAIPPKERGGGAKMRAWSRCTSAREGIGEYKCPRGELGVRRSLCRVVMVAASLRIDFAIRFAVVRRNGGIGLMVRGQRIIRRSPISRLAWASARDGRSMRWETSDRRWIACAMAPGWSSTRRPFTPSTTVRGFLLRRLPPPGSRRR